MINYPDFKYTVHEDLINFATLVHIEFEGTSKYLNITLPVTIDTFKKDPNKYIKQYLERHLCLNNSKKESY